MKSFPLELILLKCKEFTLLGIWKITNCDLKLVVSLAQEGSNQSLNGAKDPL